jgi:uncharacterized membrane protein YgdD (TMEM256/DUF423 family)
MQKLFFIAGAVLGGLVVALGAYGAHGGHQILVEHDALITFSKAIRYQMHHAIMLIVVALTMSSWKEQEKLLNIAGWLFLAGIILFSGSLYIIAFAQIKMGYITPLGGTAFVGGWFTLAYAGYKAKIKN